MRDGGLQETTNIVIWLRNFWYFANIAEERLLRMRGGCNQKIDCTCPMGWLLYWCFIFDQEFLQIEAEQRRKKEEEERQVEERRSAAKKLQSQHEELQRERQAEVRRKMETKNSPSDPRWELAFYCKLIILDSVSLLSVSLCRIICDN